MRWIVGDIQGCARELEDLMAAIRFDQHRDTLWSVGDLINRGPESLETLRLFEGIGGKAVLGNHEVYALSVAAGLWPRKQDTLDALFAAPDADVLLGRLRALPCLALLPGEGESMPDTWVVHAGLHPGWHDLHALQADLDAREHDATWLDCEEVRFATRVRCCDEAGTRHRFDGKPTQCPQGFRPWYEWYRGAAQVVHGHWGWHGYHETGRVIGLDTGCVYGGSLTAFCVEEHRRVSVPSRARS